MQMGINLLLTISQLSTQTAANVRSKGSLSATLCAACGRVDSLIEAAGPLGSACLSPTAAKAQQSGKVALYAHPPDSENASLTLSGYQIHTH